MADNLFTAVSTDTGSFQYFDDPAGDVSHAPAELVSAGPTWRRFAMKYINHTPLSRVRLLRHVYSKFRLTAEDQIAWFWLKQADFSRTGAESNDSEGLIDHLRAIEPVVVACVFEEIGAGRDADQPAVQKRPDQRE